MANKVITAIKTNKDNIRRKIVIVSAAVLGVVAAGFLANRVANRDSDELVLVLSEDPETAPAEQD